MIARRGFASEYPALLRAVYEALLADNAWEVANKDAAGRVWAKELHLPESLAPQLGQRDAVPTVAAGPRQAQQIDHIADWYVAAGIIPAKPDMAGSTIDLAR